MVHTTKSSAEIRCPSNAARNALEEEVRASLEEPALPPEVAVRRAELLRRDGQDAEAQSVVDRSFHAARAQGKRIELVPAWVSDVQYVQFQPPDRFVVSHGAGTSTFTADGLRETRRCPIDSWNLSPQGKYAHLQENTILDLDTCTKHSWGEPLAYAEDESMLVARQGTRLLAWNTKARAPLWRMSLPAENANGIGGACISPQKDRVALTFGSGEVRLYSGKDGRHLWSTKVDFERMILGRQGERRSRCEFSADGSRLNVSLPFLHLARPLRADDELFGPPVRIESATGKVLSHPDINDPVAWEAAWVASRAPRGQDRPPVHVDNNRYTIEIQGRERPVVMHLPDGYSVEALYAGRFLHLYRSREHGVWDVFTGDRLPVRIGEQPPLVLHQNALCLARRCFFSKNRLVFRDEVQYSKAGENPGAYMGRVHVARGLRLTSNEIVDTARRAVFPLQWPSELLDGQGDGPKVAGALFDEAGQLAWVLTVSGHLLAFSTDSGRVQERIRLDAAPTCKADPFDRYSSASMAAAPSAATLVVRPAGTSDCSFLVDMDAFTATSIPLQLPQDFALSGNGKRLAATEGGGVVIYSLETFRKTREFTDVGYQFALSFSGDELVAIQDSYLEKMPDGHIARIPASVSWYSVSGPEPVAHIQFERGAEAPTLEVNSRVVAIGTTLYDFAGEKVAEVFTQGRRAVVQYPTGELELFGAQGSDASSAYRCLVDGRVVPESFCTPLIVEGRLEQILGGLPDDRSQSAAAEEAPLAVHCAEPVAPCGKWLDVDASYLECRDGSHLDPAQAVCLGRLKHMGFQGNSFTGLSREQDLRELETLKIESASFQDLSPFRTATNLRRLVVRGTELTALSPLAGFEHLQEVDLSNNKVKNLDALAGLTHVEKLDLSGTHVEDLAPLRNLTRLRWLSVSHTPVEDLGPLMQLEALEELDASETRVRTVPRLDRMGALRTLILHGVPLADVRALESAPQKLSRLGISPHLLQPQDLRALRAAYPYVEIDMRKAEDETLRR